MKILQFLIVGLLTLLYSCGKPVPSIIEFDGKTFELPIKVDKAKKVFGLQYGVYSGFYKANSKNRLIETQLENYPLFSGNKNVSEESYYDNYFVGITFFKDDKSIEQYKDDFEKRYNKKFKTLNKDLGLTRTLPPFSMNYHYIKTDEGLFVSLKEIVRKIDNKIYILISFYKGISDCELEEYLEYVN